MKSPFLSEAAIAEQIEHRKGLIPIALDPHAGDISWLDLEQFHCYQGFFRDAIAFYRAICREEPAMFRTSFESLFSVVGSVEIIPPTGLVFHAGRCGSTLLTRVLARSRSNLVFGEAAPHNQFWSLAMEDRAGLDSYRALLNAMGRRRLKSYRAHFIKFSSYNIIRYEYIRSALGQPPAIFLFRQPSRLLNSYHRERAPWMGLDMGIGKRWLTPESAVEDFFRTALEVKGPEFRVLDYSDLSPRMLPAIFRHLGVEVSPLELRHMESEFLFDAKSAIPRPFQTRTAVSNPACQRADVAPSLWNLYARLRERSRLDWPD